uniref:Uncharacterized protein n=1 Tax=Rhizophora mucronata TaxID=61149 RepID=A0A2P2P2B4_RHIMU
MHTTPQNISRCQVLSLNMNSQATMRATTPVIEGCCTHCTVPVSNIHQINNI